MQNQQLPFHKKIDKLIRLGEVERRLARVMNPSPSRPTLIAYIDTGELLGYAHPINGYYLVWESSLEDFLSRIIKTKEQIAA